MKLETFTFLPLVIFGLLTITLACAQKTKTCAPDFDVSSIQDVAINENANFVFNEIEIVIDRPIDKFYRYNFYDSTLEDKIPGITVRPLNDKESWEAGHRRLICSNGQKVAVEEVIKIIPEKYFSYKVWDYTVEFLAERVKLAKGEFWYTPVDDKTHIRWRYSFEPRSEKYRKELESFVEDSWNAWMVSILDRIKKLSEENI